MSYTKVEFQPFPELQMAEIEPFFTEVKGLSTPDGLTMQSYGARVLRNCSTEDIEQCRELVQNNITRRLRTLKFKYNSILHTDNLGEFRMTAHLTTAGQAEAVVLVGMQQLFIGASVRDNATLQLYRHNRIDPSVATVPTAAYRGVLNASDVLLFDHTEVHAFRSASRKRRTSVAYY